MEMTNTGKSKTPGVLDGVKEVTSVFAETVELTKVPKVNAVSSCLQVSQVLKIRIDIAPVLYTTH